MKQPVINLEEDAPADIRRYLENLAGYSFGDANVALEGKPPIDSKIVAEWRTQIVGVKDDKGKLRKMSFADVEAFASEFGKEFFEEVVAEYETLLATRRERTGRIPDDKIDIAEHKNVMRQLFEDRDLFGPHSQVPRDRISKTLRAYFDETMKECAAPEGPAPQTHAERYTRRPDAGFTRVRPPRGETFGQEMRAVKKEIDRNGGLLRPTSLLDRVAQRKPGTWDCPG